MTEEKLNEILAYIGTALGMLFLMIVSMIFLGILGDAIGIEAESKKWWIFIYTGGMTIYVLVSMGRKK